MSKIKCLECGEILESKTNRLSCCSCINNTCVDGDDYCRISGTDLSKISVYRESSGKFEDVCL